MCNSGPEVAEEQRGFVNLRNCDSVFPALDAPLKLRLCPGSKWQKKNNNKLLLEIQVAKLKILKSVNKTLQGLTRLKGPKVVVMQ